MNELEKQGIRPVPEDVIRFDIHSGYGDCYEIAIKCCIIFKLPLLSDLWIKAYGNVRFEKVEKEADLKVDNSEAGNSKMNGSKESPKVNGKESDKKNEEKKPQKTTPVVTNPKPTSAITTKPAPKPQSLIRNTINTWNLQKPKPSTSNLRTSTSKNLRRIPEAPTKNWPKTPKKITNTKEQTSPKKIARNITESKKEETKQPNVIKSTVLDKSKKATEDKKTKDDNKASLFNKPALQRVSNKANTAVPAQKRPIQSIVTAKPVPQKSLTKKPVLKDDEMAKRQIGKYEVKRQSQVKKPVYTGFGSRVVETVVVKGKNSKGDGIDGLFVRKYIDEFYKKAVLVCSSSR